MLKILRSVLYLAVLSCLIPLTAKAQITPDDSLGEESSVVIPFDDQGIAADVIDGGASRGANLFHSFQDFNVNPDRSAVFNNPDGINNIFSRVTGTNISNINGLLGVLGDANLFLINPNGIIFGENAALNIQGSFFASTADSLLFDNNFEFSASNPQAPPLLEVSIPIGLIFRDNPGDIVNNSVANGIGLFVNEGTHLSLLGGNINLNSGIIFAPSANVELGGLTEAGIVEINDDSSLTFPDSVARGNVSLANSSLVSTTGQDGGSINVNARNFELTSGSNIFAGIDRDLGSVDAQAGDITINATDNVVLNGAQGEQITTISNSNNGTGNTGNVEITAQNISFLNGSNIFNFSNGQGNIGNITLTATGDITIDGTGLGISRSGIQSFNNIDATGNVGEIDITAQNLSITNGGQISSSVAGEGNSGNINLEIANSISIDGVGNVMLLDGSLFSFTSEISSQVAGSGVGDSGDINIDTQNLSITQNGQINASIAGLGNGGNININADTIAINGFGNTTILPSSIATVALSGLIGSGNLEASAGDITIDTNSLLINNAGNIVAGVNGIGNGGNITIDATDFIEVNNGTIEADILPESEGNGGNIQIDTARLSLTNQTSISANVFGTGDAGNITINATDSVEASSNSSISALIFTNGLGDSGDIEINTTNFSLAENALLTSSSRGQGNAGNILITATDTVFSDNGFINSNVGSRDGITAEGNVGSIQINAREINFTNTAQVQAGLFSGATGDPGTVSLIATESIDFTGENTGIFSNNEVNSVGDASNAELSAPTITFDNGAVVAATNFGQGNGGNVTIFANNLTLERNNQITGATNSGTGGIVNLQIAEDLILRSGNEISAQAFNNADGGNLTINTELIIAFPNGNNDIIASANQGNGGNINIFTQAIFGLEERPSTPPNQTNDIDASSEFGLQGGVSINTPEVDPTSGLIELPQTVGDASDQISQNPCEQGVGSEFIVTGKGGLPPNVNEALNSEEARVSLIEAIPSQQQKVEANGIPIENSTPEAVPAQGWVFNEKGEVTLTAYSTSNNEIQRSGKQLHNTCSSGIAP